MRLIYIKNQINWKERNFKSEQTQIKKYGSIKEAIKQRLEKSKHTCLKKYGVENIFQSKIVQDKLHKNYKIKVDVVLQIPILNKRY